MLKEAKIMHDTVKELYDELIPLLALIEQKSAMDHESFGREQANTTYACRETINMLKELEKGINKASKAAKLVANYYMNAVNSTKIVTEYCTATAKVRFWYQIPHKREINPEFYDDLQRFCGVKEEYLDKEGVRVHGPNLMDLLTDAIANGDSVPVDPAKVQQTEFDLIIRRKKDV